MGSEAEAVCGQLVAAVEAMVDPGSSPQIRQEALKFCENFKEQSHPALGIQCGLVLCQRSDAPFIRHFGLRLLEEIIKLRWNDMTPDEKVFVKDNAMRLMRIQVDILSEARHVKDAISRIVVEIAKREWPQHWPSFLTELEGLCSEGGGGGVNHTGTELVMFVLLRLVEDVAVLQTLEQNQRRKEIYQALTAQMEVVFAFLRGLLERHYQGYLTTKDQEKERHGRVCQAVLETYNAFVEWVPIAHIMANDQYLIKCLVHLLTTEPHMQLHAAEVLLSIVSWKAGKAQDRMQLLCLLKTDMIMPLFRAVEASLSLPDSGVQEQGYIFLKKMVQILVELGSQVCAVWNSKDTKMLTRAPDNFDTYLQAMLAFSRHPSIMVNFYANNLWGQLSRHPDAKMDPKFLAIVPKWLEVACKKLVKEGYPSKRDCLSCAYSQIDFETDDEFVSQFGKSRIIMLDTVKTLASIDPSVPYQIADTWLRAILGAPIATKEQIARAVVEIDAVAHILDAVMSRCSFPENQLILAPATDLLKKCLDYHGCNDPLVTSAVLSCISSLFVVATVTPEALMPILNQIFNCVTSGSDPSGGLPKELTQEVRALRRHGCALLVKVGSRYSSTLVPVLEHLRTTIVDDLNTRRGALHKMEYVTLVEALVLISNQVGSYDVQSRFIAGLLGPVVEKLRLLEPVISSPESFVKFIGLVNGGEGEIEQFQKNRGQIAYCIQFLLAVSRRSACPQALEKCRQGGFIDASAALKSDAYVALRSPSAAPSCSVLRHVFFLAKSFCDLWTFKDRLAPAYVKALDMLEIEKTNVLGVSGQAASNSRCSSEGPDHSDDSGDSGTGGSGGGNKKGPTSDLQRANTFVFEQFENIYHLLSQFCTTFGHEFYRLPGLSDGVVGSALQGLTSVPDFRLRAVVRTFLKSLINKCPEAHFATVLVPVFNLFCPYMLTRLTEGWEKVTKMREDPNFDPDAGADSAEVVADVIACQLTREYLDVVKALLTSGGGSDLALTSFDKSDTGDKEPSSHNLSLSPLGQLVMGHETLGQTLVQTLLRALLWPDSPSSLRAASLLEPVTQVLAASTSMGSGDAAHVMFTILNAIHTLGKYDANNIALTQLAVQTYELLRPKHQSVAEVLSQVPGCSAEDFKKFDDRVMQISGGGGTVGSRGGDKASKAMFKKIICQFTGVDVAQMFKKDVVIKNLPTLQLLKQRDKTPSLIESEAKDIGLTSLFTSPERKQKNGFPTSNGFHAAAANGINGASS